MTQRTRWERFVIWVANHSPRPVLEQPERVLINIACILIGVSAALPPVPESSIARWPDVGRYIWAGIMIVGALFSLYGVVYYSRIADRLGALIIMMGSLWLGTNLVLLGGARTHITALIFFGIAIAKFFRFIRSLAVQVRVIEYMQEEKERRDQ